MIVYRCDRCKRDIDPGSNVFDGEECLSLEVESHSCRGFNKAKHYLLCKDCLKKFKDFMNGLEVAAP